MGKGEELTGKTEGLLGRDKVAVEVMFMTFFPPVLEKLAVVSEKVFGWIFKAGGVCQVVEAERKRKERSCRYW